MEESRPARGGSSSGAEEPIVAATWQEREPSEPWGPVELDEALPWAASHVAPHTREVAADAFSDWRLVAATRRGRSHAHQAHFREDAFAVHAKEDVAVLVAADGAGSAKWSRVGAELACRASVTSLVKALGQRGAEPSVALPDAVRTACEQLLAAAKAAKSEPRDFRTTLLVAALANRDGSEWLATCQVGDGCVVVRMRDGTVRQVGTGDSGEYSGEVSCFVPDGDAFARATASVTVMDAGEIDGVLLCTDGIEDPFYPISRRGATLMSQLIDGVEAPAEFFQKQEQQGPILGQPQMLERLHTWLQFERRGENDDRTLVAAFRARIVRATS